MGNLTAFSPTGSLVAYSFLPPLLTSPVSPNSLNVANLILPRAASVCAADAAGQRSRRWNRRRR